MFTKKDRAKLDNAKEYIEYLSRSYNEVLERARKVENENITLRTKVDFYEKYIQSITDTYTNSIDKTFMFDGELYKLRDYTIGKQSGKAKTLSADFECITGITKNFNIKECDKQYTVKNNI